MTALIVLIGAVAFYAVSAASGAVSDTPTTIYIRVGLAYGQSAKTSVTLSCRSNFTVSLPGNSAAAPIQAPAPSVTASVTENGLTLTSYGGEALCTVHAGETIRVTAADRNNLITFLDKSYRDSIDLLFTGTAITVINYITIDDYIRGVLPCEVYPSWNIEALKAAAVVTRTYSLRYAEQSSHQSSGFDICTTTHCQTYGGTSKEAASTDRAVAETAGLVVTYNGELAMTPYTTCAGNATENVHTVWGSDLSRYPYLCGVVTPYEKYRSNPNGKWETVVTSEQLNGRLSSSYASRLNYNDTLTFDYTRAASGYIDHMTVTDESGHSVTFTTSDTIRSFFTYNLVKSANFGIAYTYLPAETLTPSYTVLSAEGEYDMTGLEGIDYITADGVAHASGLSPVVVLDGQGYGHGLGMSQFGARDMANAGFSYADIVKTYFPGTAITYYRYN